MEPNQTTEAIPVAPTLPVAPKVVDLFKQGWQYTKQNRDFAIWYGIVLTIMAILTTESVASEIGNEPVFVGVYIIAILSLGLMSALMAWGLLEAVLQPNQTISTTVAIQWSLKHFLLLIWTSILSTLCILLGLIFFIVPGIILSGYFYFSLYALADGKGAGTKALQYSYSLVKNQWWRTAVKVFLLGFFSFIIMILGYAAVAFIAFFAGTYESYVSMIGDVLVEGIISAVLTIITIFAMGQYYRYLQATKTQPQ